MQRDEIIKHIMEHEMIGDTEIIILPDGFEDAFLGITVLKPSRAIYSYYKCLDILMKQNVTDFDDTMDWLDEFIEEDLGKHSPIYIKLI
tara:strand:- start:767 stop:1033 length:267 start_codon:yes stop_codon:yes gene_type:complete